MDGFSIEPTASNLTSDNLSISDKVNEVEELVFYEALNAEEVNETKEEVVETTETEEVKEEAQE